MKYSLKFKSLVQENAFKDAKIAPILSRALCVNAADKRAEIYDKRLVQLYSYDDKP